MAWTLVATPVGGDVATAAWANQVKANLEESMAYKAAAAGDVFRASGPSTWGRVALGTSGHVLVAGGSYVATLDRTAFEGGIGFPPGAVITWSGSIASVPTGWVLCNGSNGTPDLRDRFIVGAGYGEMFPSVIPYNTQGGAQSYTHGHTHTAEVGGSSHTHQHTAITSGWVNNQPNVGGIDAEENISSGMEPVVGSTHYHSQTAAASDVTFGVDGGHIHEISAASANMTADPKPLYFALAFIMRTS